MFGLGNLLPLLWSEEGSESAVAVAGAGGSALLLALSLEVLRDLARLVAAARLLEVREGGIARRLSGWIDERVCLV